MSLMTHAHDLPHRRNLRRTTLQARATRLALAAAVVLVPVLAAGAQDSAPAQRPTQSSPPTETAGAPPTTRPTDRPMLVIQRACTSRAKMPGIPRPFGGWRWLRTAIAPPAPLGAE